MWRACGLKLMFYFFLTLPRRLRRPELKTRTFSCPNLYWSCLRRNCSRKQNRAKEAFAPLVNCGPVRTHWIPSLSRRFWRVRGVDNVKPCPILSFNILHVKLGAWSLVLGAWSLRLGAWGLSPGPAVERPAGEAGLFILHSAQWFHELLQVLYWFNFFHISFLVVLWQIYRPEKHQTRTSIPSYKIPGPLSTLLGAWSL